MCEHLLLRNWSCPRDHGAPCCREQPRTDSVLNGSANPTDQKICKQGEKSHKCVLLKFNENISGWGLCSKSGKDQQSQQVFPFTPDLLTSMLRG